MEIRECKSIIITMSMEEAYKLEKELTSIPDDWATTHKLYMLLPEKED